jgi:putative flippase GtrA
MPVLSSKTIREALKFLVVGVMNTGIDLIVLNLLILGTHKGQHGFYFSIFKAISFLAAMVNSYFVNKYWTFAGTRHKKSHIEVGQFVGVSLGGLVLNDVAATLVFRRLVTMSGIQAFSPTIAGIAGSAVGLSWNYVGYKTLVFRQRQSAMRPPLT